MTKMAERKKIPRAKSAPSRMKLDDLIIERIDPELYVATLEGVKTPEQELLERERWQRLEYHIDRLPPRVGLALRLWHGIRSEPRTLEQVAQVFGVTRERIRQLAAKGVRIIRGRMLREESPQRLRDIEARERRDEALKKARMDAEYEAQYREREAREAIERAKQDVVNKVLRERARVIARGEMRKRLQRIAQADYEDAYYEAHAINAGWQDEVERRAQEARQQLRNAERRREYEARVKALVIKRDMLAHGYNPKRDWLLVASKELT